MRFAHSRISPPKKNLILSAKRLRRIRHFLRRMRRAAARATGSAKVGLSYFKYSAQKQSGGDSGARCLRTVRAGIEELCDICERIYDS